MEEFIRCDRPVVRIKIGENRFRNLFVHRIICHTYFGYKTKYDVHHKDGDKCNNRLDNLMYITHRAHSGITGGKTFKKLWIEKTDIMRKGASMGGKTAMSGEHAHKIHSMGGKAGIQTLINWWTPERREANKNFLGKCVENTVWVNNGVINKRVPLEEVDTYLENGFVRGRLSFKKHSCHKK